MDRLKNKESELRLRECGNARPDPILDPILLFCVLENVAMQDLTLFCCVRECGNARPDPILLPILLLQDLTLFCATLRDLALHKT